MRTWLCALSVAVALAACEKSSGPDRSPKIVAPAPVEPAPAEPAPADPAPPAEPAKIAEAVPAETPGVSANPSMTAPSPPEFERMMEGAIAMFDAMGRAADANPDNCDKLADGLDQVLVDFKDLVAQAKRYKDNRDFDKMAEEWMKKNQGRVMPPMMRVASAGQKCASSAKFMKTMERLGELGN